MIGSQKLFSKISDVVGQNIDEIQSTTKGINNQGSRSFTSIKTTIQMSTDISVSAKPRKLTPMKKTKPKGNDTFFSKCHYA